MKNSPPSLFPVLWLIGAVLVLPSQAFGQDGPIRGWLKERGERRQQTAPAPKAGAETEAKITQAGDYTFTIAHGGLARKYQVHVPAKYRPATPAAVLFALHGGGGNMSYMATDERYGLISKSEREGFIAVFPNGYSKRSTGRFATWNAGRCCGDARDKNIDDVGFIRAVVDNVARQLNIDRHRIFATGMSNGGMMSYRLACELSDTFSGIAAVAGTDGTTTCQPKKPIPVLHIHAQNDDHVLFGGGAGEKAFRDPSKVMNFTSVPATVAKWVKANGCNPNPKKILQRPGAYCERYSPCQGKAHVQLCVTDTGGHSWPGAAKTRGEPASTAISANDVMWDFFMGTGAQ
jgi:polyhydroxybutyrate depolymerase